MAAEIIGLLCSRQNGYDITAQGLFFSLQRQATPAVQYNTIKICIVHSGYSRCASGLEKYDMIIFGLIFEGSEHVQRF